MDVPHSKPLYMKSYIKKAQLDDTHPFWSTHKQTSNHIACKPCSASYTKEFLAQKTTIHIHSVNDQLVNKLNHYSPSPSPYSFTMCTILDRFCRRPPDSSPRFFTMRLIPDWFGDFST